MGFLRRVAVGILYRYVFREVAAASLIGALLFTLALFLQSVGPVMALLVGPGAPAGEVLRLFALTIPQSFPFTIPIGVLVGILLALGRLSADNEITAMRAAGIPGLRIVRPAVVFALLGTAVCAAATLWLTPRALREQVRIAESFRIPLAGAEVRPRVFIEDFPDRVIRVQDVLPGEGIHWKGIFLADMRAPERRGSFAGANAAVDGPRITLASEAFVIPRPEQNRIQVRFPMTTTYEQSFDPKQYHGFRSESSDQVLEARPSRFDPGAKRYDRMTTAELARAARTEDDPRAGIQWQQRLALPPACLLLPLAGIPLAVASRRAGRSGGVVTALALVFVYWMIQLAGTALAEQGTVGPALAAWAANAVFGLAGVFLLTRLDAPNRRDWSAAVAARWSALRDRLAKTLARRRERNGAAANGSGAPEMRSGPALRIVDRYVLRSFLFHLAVFTAAFIAIWFVFSFFELLTDMLARGKLGRFIPYIYYLTPFLIYNTAPLAVMAATLICFGLLAKRHELTAFRASGVSLYRLAWPVLAFALLLSGGLFALDHYYLPQTNRRQDAIRDEIKGRPARTYLRPDRQWTFGLRNRIFYHRAFDSTAMTFSGISVYDLREEPFELRRHIAAERAWWSAKRGVWVFERGWMRELEGIHPTRFEQFERREFPDIVEPPDYFLKEDRHDQQMNWRQLQAYIVDLTQSGFDTIRLQVRLHKKLAFPLFAFSMALLAAPFAMLIGRQGAMAPVVFSLGLTIGYYALNALAEQLGRNGQLTPLMAAWAPCLIFALGGAYLFLRVRT